ncbi:DUF4407 domain-containing protein [Aureivirga sp. CE67]|uniref:DUF4407 domain-containing protein n=1 Tax=Aureivirga sp. CE67 TaxID=1788983 RepID=UPI0018CBBA97|nr:DUF4407 domain-containing protein [Aureivirga sp. CE67]
MLNKFFLWCSGVDTELLEKCPKSEKIKYFGIGGTVLFTAIMASISGGFALFTVFKNLYVAIGFGFLWGLLIFNLDRFIVSTLKKQNSKFKEFTQILPRIILAIVIAVVIAKPLELKLFEKEINQVLQEEENQKVLQSKEVIGQQFAEDIKANNTKIDLLKDEIALKKAEVDSLYTTYITEAEGKTGTRKLGKGPVYKEKREKHDFAFNELQLLQTTNHDKILELEEANKDLKQLQIEKEAAALVVLKNSDGLLRRIKAMGKLDFLPQFFIMLLFIIIETAPIITKFLTPKGIYDYHFQNEESHVKNWAKQEETKLDQMLKSADHINKVVHENVRKNENLIKYKTEKEIEVQKTQTEAYLHKQGSIFKI